MTSLPSTPASELDQLTITIVVDNATDTLSSIAPGIPQLPEMAYLLGRIPPSGQHDGHDCVVTFDHLCVACHGFSALATARQGDRTATVLFDVGPYGDVWLANAERLAVDLSTIDVLFLSHWHWDHSGGITTVVAAIAAARAVRVAHRSSSTSTLTGRTGSDRQFRQRVGEQITATGTFDRLRWSADRTPAAPFGRCVGRPRLSSVSRVNSILQTTRPSKKRAGPTS